MHPDNSNLLEISIFNQWFSAIIDLGPGLCRGSNRDRAIQGFNAGTVCYSELLGNAD